MTGEKVSIEYMNSFVEPKYQIKEYAYKSKLTKAEAQEKYPEWYEERIVKGNKNVLHPWALNRSVYDWWLRQIRSGAKVRHRYWCLWILAIYAKKCSFYDPKKNPNPVTREELEHDAWSLLGFLDEMTETEDNHFTEIDVIEALEAFEDRFISYPKASIRYKSNIPFEPAIRRNGRKQPVHLERARAVQNIDFPEGDCRNKNGRPRGSGEKSKIVEEWRLLHPDGKKIECERETGLSRHTVLKWWDKIEEGGGSSGENNTANS